MLTTYWREREGRLEAGARPGRHQVSSKETKTRREREREITRVFFFKTEVKGGEEEEKRLTRRRRKRRWKLAGVTPESHRRWPELRYTLKKRKEKEREQEEERSEEMKRGGE